ncbi:MAG: hypothetical protein ABWZ25_15760 [Chitinophagaceae bacterium]
MPYESIIEKLSSKKSAERRKAAKDIGKQKITTLSEELFNAYLEEKKDKRTWETQTEMILSLGLIDYKPALSVIEPIVFLNASHDMITYASAQTYVRLKRKSIHDAQPIIELLKFGGLSLVDGALNPLAYDKMMPPREEIIELIQLSRDLHNHKDYERGYSDPRYGLAAACAGWDKKITEDFLNHCLATAGMDNSLIHAAEGSLKGKYIALR